MTVSSSTRRAGPFNGNDVTTAFPFTFKVFASTDVAVYVTDDEGNQELLASNYSVSLNSDQDTSPGGTVNYPTSGDPLPDGYTLDVISEVPYTQSTRLTTAGRFLPDVVERALDKATILIQQLYELLGRTLRFPTGDTASGTLPSVIQRAGKFLGFDADGNPTALSGTGADAALRTDLAASGGAALVGFVGAGGDAQSRSAQLKLRDWVSVKDYGAAGDDATDDANAIRACFLEAAALGKAILIPPGVYRMSVPLDVLANTTVLCLGTLKITAAHGAGGFLIIKGTDDNIHWIGGTIDGGGTLGVTNMNGIAAAYDPTGSTTSKNIRFDGVRIVNCRIDAAMDAVTPFSGGGKGLTLQFHINGAIFSNIVIEDCSVPFSVESAVSDSRYAENMVLSNIVARNCTRGPFFAGSKPAATSSIGDWGYEESKLGQCVLRGIVLDNCGEEGTTYACITANYANCLDAEFTIRSSAAEATLWRGNIAHSTIRIQAFVDNLKDGVNMTPYTGASLAALSSAGNKFDVELHVADAITGALWKGDATTLRTRLACAYYHDTSPTYISGVPANAALRYRFFNMRTGTIAENSTDIVAAPDAGAPKLGLWGAGTPEGVVTAPKGSQFARTDGGAGTSFYIKESGSGNTGWVAK